MSVCRAMLVLVALALGGCKYRTEEVEIGHLGKARRDPFLAAQRYLSGMGYGVERKASLRGLPDRQTVIVTSSEAFNEPGMSDEVMRWVRSGGHLVLCLRGAEMFVGDWGFFGEPTDPKRRREVEQNARKRRAEARKSPDESGREDPAVSEEKKLLTALNIAGMMEEAGTADGEVLGRKASVWMPMRFSMTTKPPGGAAMLGSVERAAIASFEQGRGHVTVIAHAKPFRNRYIGDGDNAWLLWLLVGQHGPHSVWFVSGVKVSFFAMLWEHGWTAIIALVLLIGFWLWKSWPRFGPLKSGQDYAQRQFSSHLALAGAFLWRQRETAALLAPLRRAVLGLAARRGMHESATDFYDQLSARSGVPAGQVRDALSAVGCSTPHHFQRLIADLEKIRQSL